MKPSKYDILIRLSKGICKVQLMDRFIDISHDMNISGDVSVIQKQNITTVFSAVVAC
jgi:hypothetical protein